MDNVTHTLAGAALGEAGLKRLSGLGMAALLIGANLPDLDVLAIPSGAGLTFRRGWTHGALALVVLPALLTLALVGWDRLQARVGRRPGHRPPVRPRELLLLSFLGVLSHPLLDWLNTYGVRLLMPFRETWFYGDALFILDPWLWLVLGAGVILSRRRGRVTGRPVPGPARVALAVTGLYLVLMIAGSRSAQQAAVRHHLATEGTVPERVMAGPVPLRPLRRTLVYDLGDRYRFGTLSWSPGPRVSLDPGDLPVGTDHPALAYGLARREVRDFLGWARFPYLVVEEDARGTVLRVGDARYRREPEGWAAISVRLSGPEAP